ncbi:lamin-C [Elysia marginata]|uniref:Lamin-C n=1 Tax=Elysia marginata TaxID=1093978 RepID=A0AAV4EDD6_9GAST|nr:lamin-C [Elysia marginata]
MKRRVRFKDLGQIQEEDGSQAGEITLVVPPLPVSGAEQPREPEPASCDLDLEVKPAACPFGDRIAKERAARELTSKPPRPAGIRSQQALDDAFPRNVLLRQREQRQKNAQRPRTAGVNPASGKERGRSFISTRSYISHLTDPPLSPTSPPPVHPPFFGRPRAKSAGSATRTPITYPISGSPAIDPSLDFPQAWGASSEPGYNFRAGDIATSTTGVGHQEIVSSSQPQYKPDPRLAVTVNPYCPPRQQIYGSAAYQLRDVDRDRPAAPTTVSDSKVNQYLHQTSDIDTVPQATEPTVLCTPSADPQIEGVISRPDYTFVPAEEYREDTSHLNNDRESEPFPQTNGNQLQFLRDNCASPVPISKQTLFLCPSSSNTVVDIPEPETVSAAITSNFVPSPPQLPQQSLAPSKSHLLSQPLLGTSFTNENNYTFHPQPFVPESYTSAITTPAPAAGLQLSSSSSAFPLPLPPQPVTATTTTAAAAIDSPMTSYIGNMGVTGPATSPLPGNVAMFSPMPPSRVQEKEELQRLNERFSSYISRVRQLGQAANAVDSSAFLRSSKILEDEIVQLKAMYEAELAKFRRELDASGHERNSLHTQYIKQQKQLGELTDR